MGKKVPGRSFGEYRKRSYATYWGRITPAIEICRGEQDQSQCKLKVQDS